MSEKKQESQSHAMLVGGFSPFTKGHDENVKQMKDDGHTSINIFTTQSSRRPISAEKKVDYIKTAVGSDVNVDSTTTPLHAASQLYSSGKRGKLVVYGGSDRSAIADRIRDYNNKESKHGFYNFDSVEYRQVGGERKEGAKGLAGISGSAARKAKNARELKKFLPKALHSRADEIFKDLREETNPTAFFLIGGPGSGKDFVLKNTFAKYDLMEVQIDQVLNGAANSLFEDQKNLVINGPIDEDKIEEIKSLHEDYNFDVIYVSVTNKVSRQRNEQRENPLNESKRIQKFLNVEKLIESLEDVFVFNNSMNLNAASAFEKIIFEDQTVKLEKRIQDHGIIAAATPELKSFVMISEKYRTGVPKDKESGLPKKYRGNLSASTARARKSHWEKMSKYSDRDPRAYEPAPGDAESETKPSKHTLAVHKEMGVDEAINFNRPIPPVVDPRRNRIARTGNITAVMQKRSLLKKMQTISESTDNYNLKQLIDTTKNITNQLSIPVNKLHIIAESKAIYSENNIFWEAIKHPSSQRWYLTGKYNENNDE
jgi:dephospho-CoA kinase